MHITRRNFIRTAVSFAGYYAVSMLGLNASLAVAVAERLPHQFTPGSINESMHRLFGSRPITETGKIHIKIPKIAENGAVVPLTVTSELPSISVISILVEKNPVPLAARFELTGELEPFVSARLKMAETCDVIAVAETPDGLFSAKELVKVTIGGCGG